MERNARGWCASTGGGTCAHGLRNAWRKAVRGASREIIDEIYREIVGISGDNPADTDRYIALGYGDVPILILEQMEREYGILPERPTWLTDFEATSDKISWMRTLRRALESHKCLKGT